ncbi:MAG: acylhydrolase [Lachnospiraceae bacterium]|nr:acylhydrolase [Lachnospiraceae bacterium]
MIDFYYRIRVYIFPVALLLLGALFIVFVDRFDTYESLYTRAHDSIVSTGENMGLIKKTEEMVVPVTTGDISTVVEKPEESDPVEEITDSGEAMHGERIDELTEELTFVEVEDDYFEDAAFIGDSRVVGLYEYGGWQDIAHFYAAVGLNIYKLFDVDMDQVDEEGHKYTVTLEEGLTENDFRKIYIMLGINEVGTGNAEYFVNAYREQLERIKELQPNAIIYVMSIMNVSQNRSNKGDHVNRDAINERNEALAELEDGKRVFYLDVNEAVCDEEGYLIGDYTFDGVHLKAQYVKLWQDYLRTHAYDIIATQQ